MWDGGEPPSYGVLWNLMAAIDDEGLAEVLSADGSPEAAMSADIKVLRGRDQDRLHGRAIGFSLSALRDAAINLIRRAGFHYIPDAKRFLPARSDLGLALPFEA
jgi:hypothetical protein